MPAQRAADTRTGAGPAARGDGLDADVVGAFAGDLAVLALVAGAATEDPFALVLPPLATCGFRARAFGAGTVSSSR